MYKKSVRSGRRGPSSRSAIRALIVLLIALIAAFGVTLAVALNARPAIVEVPEDYVYPKNISVGGVDIGAKTKDEALALLKRKEQEMLSAIEIEVAVKDQTLTYKAADLAITSNLETAMGEAMLFAQRGDGYDDAAGLMTRTEDGADFALKPVVDKNTILDRLKSDTEKLNIPPVDATVSFDPEKDEKFTFQKEKKGAEVDIAALSDMVADAAREGGKNKITAPIREVEPEYTAEEMEKLTALIGKYTSSFAASGLHSSNRVYNIKKMASVINGQIIRPGETWSMNETAGDRTSDKGWKDAPGIENGVYTDQPGGGVCQVSSTVYNAALRAEMDIVDRESHSWPSTYIPAGLDATISSGAPDLKLRNNKTLPVYIISYVNSKKRTVTVEIYGEPPAHGYKVEMTSIIVETQKPGKPEIEYRDTDANGEPLKPGASIQARESKPYKRVRVYKQYVDKKTKKVVKSIFMYEDKYRAKNAIYYENPEQPKPEDTQ